MTTEPAVRKRSTTRRVIVVLALLVLAAAAWSGVWFYAANRAEREIGAWLERESQLGRTWSCADRHIAGFPFRFELVCAAPSLETRGVGVVRVTAVSARATAEVFAPNHIVATFTGPAQVEDRATGQSYAATWSQLQMSGTGDLSGKPEYLVLTAHEPRVDQLMGDAARTLLGAQALALEVRRVPAATGLDGLDYSVNISGGQSALLTAFGLSGPVDAVLQGEVTAAADLRPMALDQRLRAWVEAGGVARIRRFVVTMPNVAASASGEVSFDPQGRLNGAVDVAFAGLNDLVRQLDRNGLVPSQVSPVVSALSLVGRPTTVDGRRGVSFPLSFKAGTLRLNGFPVGIVPPVF